jgi:hypothetical protein
MHAYSMAYHTNKSGIRQSPEMLQQLSGIVYQWKDEPGDGNGMRKFQVLN